MPAFDTLWLVGFYPAGASPTSVRYAGSIYSV